MHECKLLKPWAQFFLLFFLFLKGFALCLWPRLRYTLTPQVTFSPCCFLVDVMVGQMHPSGRHHSLIVKGEQFSPWCGQCSCPSRCRPACRSRPPLWSSRTPVCSVQHCPVFALTRRERGEQIDDEESKQGPGWLEGILSVTCTSAKKSCRQSKEHQNSPLNENHNQQIYFPHCDFEESQSNAVSFF